jgi:outer membrane protein assembly factor BamB
VQWHATLDHPLVDSARSVADDLVLVWGRDRCDGAAHLVAGDAGSGEERWSVGPVDADGPAEVRTTGDVVVGADGADIVAWELTTGEERWRTRGAGDADVQIAADGGGVVATATDAPGSPARVSDLDPTTGEARWSVTLEGGRQVIDVAVTAQLVLVRTWGSTRPGELPTTEVEALDRSDGTRRWRSAVGISEIASPLVYALDTGQPRWTTETRRPVVAVTVAAGDVALVQTGEGPGCSD